MQKEYKVNEVQKKQLLWEMKMIQNPKMSTFRVAHIITKVIMYTATVIGLCITLPSIIKYAIEG